MLDGLGRLLPALRILPLLELRAEAGSEATLGGFPLLGARFLRLVVLLLSAKGDMAVSS